MNKNLVKIKDRISIVLLTIALSPIMVILKAGNWMLKDTTITWGGDSVNSDELEERKKKLREESSKLNNKAKQE